MAPGDNQDEAPPEPAPPLAGPGVTCCSSLVTDCIVVGAGAAGCAASRRLARSGRRVLLLEAADCIGGRVRTLVGASGISVECGGEFIHGLGRSSSQLLAEAGMPERTAFRRRGFRWAAQGEPALPERELPEETRTAFEQIEQAEDELMDHGPLTEDVSMAEWVGSWADQGVALGVAEVVVAQSCCARLDELSAEDYRRDLCSGCDETNESRPEHGYTALLQWMVQECQVELGAVVRKVVHDPRGVSVVTADGTTYEGRACIVTVPVGCLQAGHIVFEPPLCQEKQQAIRSFRVGAATKLIYEFTQSFWGDEDVYLCQNGRVPRWWTDNRVMTGYATAARADALDAVTEEQALQVGMAELGVLLGYPASTLAANVVWRKRVSWALEPFALGGYASVPVGCAASRPQLATAEHRALLFAGEATAYESNPQTVHGAIDSGHQAASQLLLWSEWEAARE